jgi:hypothetical protein
LSVDGVELVLGDHAVPVKKIFDDLLISLDYHLDTDSLPLFNVIKVSQLYKIILSVDKFLRKAYLATRFDQRLAQ